MEPRHTDALRRIAEAEAFWRRDGQEPTPFYLEPVGGMQRVMEHPRWNKSWATPDKVTIDDLAELGFVRVEPVAPNSNKRVFSLTMKGRERAATLDEVRVVGVKAPDRPADAVSEPDARTTAASQTPTAIVCWAHEDEAWQETVVSFAVTLRKLGIDADVDLFHQHDQDVDWTTYGPQAIADRAFALVAVSRAYKERWEGRADPRVGAGAVREANVLKTLFNQDRGAFRRKVKVVVLPGATVDDIPAELAAATQHFDIKMFDEEGLEDLLRTLAGRPAYVAPPLGTLPPLRPKPVGVRADQEISPYDKRLAARVAALPEREKLVVALFYYENMTQTEIAEVLGMPESRVRQIRLNAVRRLRSQWDAPFDDLPHTEEVIWTGKLDDGGGKITRPQKETLQKLTVLREIDIDTELRPPIGKVMIRPDGTAAPVSDDPDEIPEIMEFLRRAGVST
jgi:RNA polymerase sigma factor (sigma-70 family)